jgi:hypothetical protein
VAVPVYSVRFIQVHGLTSTSAYVVPAGRTAVVRDLDSFIGTPAGLNALFLHGALGQAIWWTEASVGQTQYASWRGRQVYLEGESIEVEADVGIADAYDVTVSGYLLTNA